MPRERPAPRQRLPNPQRKQTGVSQGVQQGCRGIELAGQDHQLRVGQNIADDATVCRRHHSHERGDDERRPEFERDVTADHTEGGEPQGASTTQAVIGDWRVPRYLVSH